MKNDTLVYPEACPHCGKSINHLRPVGQRALEAARAICLPQIETSRDLAVFFGITQASATMLLHRASEAGLITKKQRITSHKNGGSAYIYTPSQRLKAYAPMAYKQWERNQRNKAA